MSKKKTEKPNLPAVAEVQAKKANRLSVMRIVVICLVAAATLGFAVSALVTVLSPSLQEQYGGWLANAARVLDPTFPDGLNETYGRLLGFGYFGVATVGLLAISCLLRYQRRRLSGLFFALFVVLAIAADVLFWVFTSGSVEYIIANGDFATDGVYRLLGFIPIPNLFAMYFLFFSRAYLYAALPLVAQLLMLWVYFGTRRFKTWLHEVLTVAAFVLLIGFTGILVCYVLLTVVAVVLIVTVLWALKGFFTIDAGAVVHTSDGGSLYQVDGDLYSDGNGNYYTYDGESFH